MVMPENLTMEQVVEKNALVELGGQYWPPDCWAQHHMAVVVPYCGQAQHLQHLLLHLRPFLQPQPLQYAICVVNQVRQEWGGAGAREKRVSAPGLGESGLQLPVSELRASGPESIQGVGLMSQEELALGETRTKG